MTGAATLARELARAGIGASVPQEVRSHQALTYVLAVRPVHVAPVLAMSRRIAAALDVPSVRISQDGARLLVETPLPKAERRPLLRIPPGDGVRVSLGRDTLGRVVSLDLADAATPHLLVAGTTGSGKSEALRTIVASLARQNDPADLALTLIDGKAEAFAPFARLAHLTRPVAVAPDDAAAALDAAVAELAGRADGWTRRWVIVVDELRYILTTGALSALERLAATGRSRGVHVIVATQYASSDVLGRIAKANLPARLVGAVDDAQASLLATGLRGADAHRLAGAGDMILRSGATLRRLQVALTGSFDDLPQAEHDLSPSPVIPREAHPSQVPAPVASHEVAWAKANGRLYAGQWRPAGIGKLRRHFGIGEERARRIIAEASA